MESSDLNVLRTLQRVSARLDRADTVNDVRTAALAGLAELLDVERAAILEMDGLEIDSGGPRVHASRGLTRAFGEAVGQHLPWPPDARDPTAVSFADVGEGAPEALRASMRAEGIGALALAPLTRHGRLTGALLVATDRPRTFGEVELLAAGLLAALFAARIRPSSLDADQARVGRFEALAVLAKGVAHDFNNVLTAIVMNLGVAERHLGVDHAARRYTVAAVRACDHAKTLTRQLHALAQGGSPLIAAVTALPSILHTSSGLALQGSPVRVTIDTPDGLWRAIADGTQIGRVVHDLVTNAHQAMPDGGQVRITARNVDVSPGDPLPLRPGRYVAVSVHDQGPGIPAEHLPRVFDPYFTTKPSAKGLGLATSHAVLHRHGGNIAAESPPEGGARLVFHLPAAEDPRVDPREPASDLDT